MNWGDMSHSVRRLKAHSFPILVHLFLILHYSSLELEAGGKKCRYYTKLIFATSFHSFLWLMGTVTYYFLSLSTIYRISDTYFLGYSIGKILQIAFLISSFTLSNAIELCTIYWILCTGAMHRCLQTNHRLWTPNEGIDQTNLTFWADVADKICFGRT